MSEMNVFIFLFDCNCVVCALGTWKFEYVKFVDVTQELSVENQVLLIIRY